jgi:hypothetical protein
MQHRGLPTRRPGACPCRAGAQPAFINEDNGPPLAPGFFLMPASPSAASDGSPFHPVPPPGVRAVGN